MSEINQELHVRFMTDAANLKVLQQEHSRIFLHEPETMVGYTRIFVNGKYETLGAIQSVLNSLNHFIKETAKALATNDKEQFAEVKRLMEIFIKEYLEK